MTIELHNCSPFCEVIFPDEAAVSEIEKTI